MFKFRHLHGHLRGGYTALELAAVVLIIMVLTLGSLAGVRHIGYREPVEQNARRLAQAFAGARSYAIANNSTFTVRIDLARRNFWIDETSPAGATIQPKVTRPELLDPTVAVEQFIYGALVNESPQHSVRFFADGSSDDVSIVLRRAEENPADEKDVSTVRLYGPTGQSKVFHGRRLTPALSPL